MNTEELMAEVDDFAEGTDFDAAWKQATQPPPARWGWWKIALGVALGLSLTALLALLWSAPDSESTPIQHVQPHEPAWIGGGADLSPTREESAPPLRSPKRATVPTAQPAGAPPMESVAPSPTNGSPPSVQSPAPMPVVIAKPVGRTNNPESEEP